MSPLPNVLFVEEKKKFIKSQPTVQTQEVFLFCFSFHLLFWCFLLLHDSTDFGIPLDAESENPLSIFIAVV